MPSFSTTRSEEVFSGRIATSIRCRPTDAEAVVDRHRDGTGDDAAAGVRLVDPVADRGVLRRAADDVAHRQLADEAAVVLDDERQLTAGACLVAHRPHHRRRSCAAAPATATGAVASQRPSHARLAARTRRQSSRSRWVIGRSTTPRDSRTHRPARAQWSLPSICSTACRSRGTTTARPSFTPPRDPGRFTTSAWPTRARDAARQGRRRDALADPVGPDRLGDARHLSVDQRSRRPRA